MADIRKDLLNQELLAEHIKTQEQNYLTSIINDFNTPELLNNCEKAKEDAIFEGKKERVAELERVINIHKSNINTWKESKELAEKTIDFLKSLNK
jgi:hypothetical protein